MFILLIGNNYGSLYYRNKSNDQKQNSVTMQEFKRSLETKLAKHIFINYLVKNDYENYRRHLEEKYKKFFSENQVDDINIETQKQNIILYQFFEFTQTLKRSQKQAIYCH
jgi:hydroxymethylpyrimidine pyrophosphatase-like HAD family hydrolase